MVTLVEVTSGKLIPQGSSNESHSLKKKCLKKLVKFRRGLMNKSVPVRYWLSATIKYKTTSPSSFYIKFIHFLIVFEYHVCYRRMEKVHGLR